MKRRLQSLSTGDQQLEAMRGGNSAPNSPLESSAWVYAPPKLGAETSGQRITKWIYLANGQSPKKHAGSLA